MKEFEIRTRAKFGNMSGKCEPARCPAAAAAAAELGAEPQGRSRDEAGMQMAVPAVLVRAAQAAELPEPSLRHASTALLRRRTRRTRHRSPRPHKRQCVGLPRILGLVVLILRSNRIKIEYHQAKSGPCNLLS